MRKKLTAAIIVVCILLAAAVGFLVYMEGKPTETTDPSTTGAETTAPDGATQAQEETTEPTEETLGISLPTEDPAEVGPDMTFPSEEGTGATAPSGDPDATWDPDENETPEMPA